jgi:drug/metabolite transporter (DMT)-like permease
MGALACLILLDASGKWLGMRGVPVAASSWSRYAGHMILVLAIYLPSRGLGVLRTRSPLRQGLRGGLMLTVTLLFFAGVAMMPLAQATSVFFMTPILVTVLAAVFLRERPGWQTWAAVVCGFVGVLVVVRPGTELPIAGVLLVFGAAVANAAYQTLTRAQSQVDAPEVQVLYSGLVGAALMTAAMPLWWTPGWWQDPALRPVDWFVFAMLGVVGASGHLLLAKAFRLAEASQLTPWSTMQMVMSVALGWLAFGDVPDAIAVAGMVLIAASPNLARARRRPAAPRPV